MNESHEEVKRLMINLHAKHGEKCIKRLYPTILAHSVAVIHNLMPKPVIEYWQLDYPRPHTVTRLSRDY